MLMLTFLQKSKGMVDHLTQLLQHVNHGWLVGPFDGHLHCGKDHEVVDALVVAPIGCS
jgi:hypothetical protein